MVTARRPSREEFVAFWKDQDTFSWRKLMPYVLCLGPLITYAYVIPRLDSERRFWLLTFVVALAYVILFPWIGIRWYHKRFARFIRCPCCGDWFGQDTSGAYSGPNPKFRGVIGTGCCGKCGEQILSL
jgi:hypothetical protein